MTYAGVKNDTKIDDLIAFLKPYGADAKKVLVTKIGRIISQLGGSTDGVSSREIRHSRAYSNSH